MNSTQTPYDLLGGEEKLRELVTCFYGLMDAEPGFAGIRRLHQRDLSQAREKLYMFLSGWLDGPPLYAECYGHPIPRAQHLPLPIGASERDLWLGCMNRAMEDMGVESNLRRGLYNALFEIADWMRNREEA